MVRSLYVRATGYPMPEKQFALTLRCYDGVEVGKYDVSFFGFDMARDIVLTGQVGWEESQPTMIECAHCRNVVTKPCVTMADLQLRAARFPKSACVERLAVAEDLRVLATPSSEV